MQIRYRGEPFLDTNPNFLERIRFPKHHCIELTDKLRYSDTMLAAAAALAGAVSRIPTFLAKFRQYFLPGAWRCQAQFYREIARGRRDAGNNRHVQRWWWPVTAVQGSCPIEGGRAWLFTENFAENSIPSMKKCASYMQK